MAQYRKKPVVIEAVLWNGGNYDEVARLGDIHCGANRRVDRALPIKTLGGEMLANVGDWIIRGVKGELYPCKPDIFAATYDALPPTPHELLPQFRKNVAEAFAPPPAPAADVIPLDARRRDRQRDYEAVVLTVGRIMRARIDEYGPGGENDTQDIAALDDALAPFSPAPGQGGDGEPA